MLSILIKWKNNIIKLLFKNLNNKNKIETCIITKILLYKKMSQFSSEKNKDMFVEAIRSFVNDKSIENPESYFDEIAPNQEIKDIMGLIHNIEKCKKMQKKQEDAKKNKNMKK